MQDPTGEIGSVPDRRLFLWTHLFRAFAIAVDLRKLLLAGLALVLLPAGEHAFRFLPFAPEPAEHDVLLLWPWDDPRPAHETGGADPAGATAAPKLAAQAPAFLQPLQFVVRPAAVLLRTDGTWGDAAYAWTQLLWVFAVWAVFGGAITRMAAVQFARDDRAGLRSALKFSGEKFLSYFTAPLLYVAFIGLMWLLCLAGGLVGRIPYAGETLLGLFWIVPLALGFLMAVLLIGLAAGWPLMLAAVSTEGTDAFDGFGRSFGYIYDRPWHYAWYALVALAYGAIVTLFVWGMAVLFVYLAGWGVAAGLGTDRTAELFRSAPGLLGGSNLLPGEDRGGLAIGPPLVGAWLNLVALLVVGFVYSYFWSAWTIIYFLLRQTDDATGLDQVYLPDEDEEDDLLPLLEQSAAEPKIVSEPAGRESAG